MHSSRPSATFTLSRDVDGTISGAPDGVSPGDVPLLFRSGIDVLGGTLWFDVRRTEAIPFVDITRPAGAAWWVEAALGAEAAAQLAEWTPAEDEAVRDNAVDPEEDDLRGAEFGDDDLDDFDDGDLALLMAVVEVEEATASITLDLDAVGETLSRLRRLAVGHWLRRYWPVGKRVGFGPLNSLVMDCELASLAWSLDDVLLTRQHAGPLLAPHAARLVDLLDDEGAVTGDPSRVLWEAVEVARHSLLPSHPAYQAICELTRPAESPGAVVVPFRPTVPVPVGWRRSDVALAAGDDEGDEGERRVDEVDWRQVPGQLLDWGPDAVSWTLRRDGEAWEVAVTVLAGAAPPPRATGPSSLRAVVFTHDATGRPVQLGAADLEWAVGGGALFAVVRLDALPGGVAGADAGAGSGAGGDLDADALVVNVVDASVRMPWPTPRSTLREQQEEARGVIKGRATAADPFVAETAAFAVEPGEGDDQ